MRTATTTPMTYVEADGRRLLAGRIAAPVASGSWAVLTKDAAGNYLLQLIEPEADARCPSALAAFLPPEVVDAIEGQHAAALAAAASRPKRKPRKRRKASEAN